MIIGKSDRRITIQSPTATVNGYGEPVVSWSTHATVWAELVKTASMRERIDQEQEAATTTLAFKVRSSTDTRSVGTDYRVVYDGKNYDISGIEEIGRNDQLMFTCVLDASTYTA